MTARVALVTGGGRGLGAAMVAALARDGWQVGLTWRTDEAAAQSVVARHPGAARAFQLDLRDRERPPALVEEVEETLGPIGALVNNAGEQREGLVAMTPDRDWEAVVDANLGGTFRLCRAVLRGMVVRRSGVIVNVASLSAWRGVTGQGAYAASKAGVLALTRTLAREVGRRGVRANAVVPGFVATGMTEHLPEAIVGKLRAAECLPRGVSADDVAEAVTFLVSDRAASITGQALAVDAGAST
jgi:3-oxoacyl-[acyl-carrier protein] reductase